MTSQDEATPNAHRRFWYQTIAARLLLAFALIAGLTAIAALVAVVQFKNIDAAMEQLTEASLPAVKHSLAVESNAKAIAAGGAQVAAATTELQRFSGMTEATERIGNLWAALSQLRSVTGETDAITKLQAMIAAIDGRLGQLDRVIRERITLVSAVEQATERVSAGSGAIAQKLTALTPGDPAALRAVNDLRADTYLAAGLLQQAASTDKPETLSALQTQFDVVGARLSSSLALLNGNAGIDVPQRGELDKLIRTLLDGSANINVFHLRQSEIAQSKSAADLQGSLQKVVAEMETLVATLVAGAEQEAAKTTQLTASALANTRFWLIGISFLSLAVAILIAWFFVVRYIIARLNDLARSMMAVAGGKLDAPIPEAGADELGDMSRALIVFRDNAREIRAAREEAEQARHQAEAASRTKSSFLANMSHELRTPLNAIIGYSEILREDAVDRGDTASQSDLVKIETAGKHLLGLINDILDLSKIEAGRMDIHLEDVDLDKLVSEVGVLVAPLMSKNDNSLKVDVAHGIGVMRIDIVKLKQGLINLLSNAAKFTKNGVVGLTIARKTGADGARMVSFAVSDSGIGMTPEQLGRLFQAFTQADATTTRNYGGTGLGLTITKHFCTMLGGTIDVASEPGKGSVFTMTLPDGAQQQAGAVSVATASAAKSPMPAGTDGRGKTVLIVDDDATVHDVLRLTLAKEGYRLLHAYDGAEALALAHADPPDVITLDVMMPQLDGWTVLGRLKSDPVLSSIPVIMLTIVDERTMGYSLGAAEYMTKPVDRARLIELLRRFANTSQEAIVLVVDDDVDVRTIVRTTVQKTGLKAVEADNGRAALDWLQVNPAPALILLDLMMPVMDGFAFLEEVKDNAALAQVPIVVLTAKELTDAERRVVNERTLLVLTKGAQPLSSLGSALSAIARQPAVKPETV